MNDRRFFIGIGAQKCASTWIHRILAEHPDIGVSDPKELDFFSRHFDRGFSWYGRHFEHCDTPVVGEISPSYLHSEPAPERVARYLPNARLIVSFREPVARALSNHRHEVRVGHLNGSRLRFEDGLARNPMYVEQGRYAQHLRRWLRHFPRDRIFVVLVDDIHADPGKVAAELYRFLDVDDAFVPSGLQQRFNRSFAHRSALMTAAKNGFYRLASNPGLGWLWSAASMAGMKSLYRRFNVVDSEAVIPTPGDDTLQELRREFAPDIRELSTLIDRNLDIWLDQPIKP